MSSAELNPQQELRHSPIDFGIPTIGMEILKNVTNDDGKPRLSLARQNLLIEMRQANVGVLSELYRSWRDFDEYLLLKGTHFKTGEEKFIAVKCSKRGNDIFSERLNKKLGFLHTLDGVTIFKPSDFENKYNPVVKTNLLWVTLTYDSKKCSLRRSWESVISEWNLFITNLRNKYGKISYIRFSEAFPSPNGLAYGYPHIHVVLLFEEHQFKVFPRMEKFKDGRIGVVYRIREKKEIEKQGKWHSYIDIKAISSSKSLGEYLRKHCKNTHNGDTPEALVTQSLLWLYRKTTYSMSCNFRQKLNEFTDKLQESKTKIKQATLDGETIDIWVWTFHGTCSEYALNVPSSVNVHSLDKKEFNKLMPERYKKERIRRCVK